MRPTAYSPQCNYAVYGDTPSALRRIPLTLFHCIASSHRQHNKLHLSAALNDPFIGKTRILQPHINFLFGFGCHNTLLHLCGALLGVDEKKNQ